MKLKVTEPQMSVVQIHCDDPAHDDEREDWWPTQVSATHIEFPEERAHDVSDLLHEASNSESDGPGGSPAACRAATTLALKVGSMAHTPNADSNIPSASENDRLDDLIAYCSTLLNHLHGEELDAALEGEIKRRGLPDAALRQRALDNVHPDDLAAALARKGITLGKFGITEVRRGHTPNAARSWMEEDAARRAREAGAYRRNPSVHTGVEETIRTDSYVPQVGDEHDIAAPGMYPFTAVVTEIDGNKAKVAQSSGYGVWMPKASVAHFVNDLRGVVDGPRSSNPIIEAVLSGEAEFLGKGDDGLSFRIGDTVVKVSTTVPYQPFNPGHRTPAEAVVRLRDQWTASEEAAAAGVPGILPTEFIQHGDKGFILKPYVEIPDHLDRKELDAVAESVEAAHRAGWVFGDEIQVGVLRNQLYHFDTGKLMRSDSTDPDYWRSDAHHDIEALKRLFSKYGQLYLTASQKSDPIQEFDGISGADLRAMTDEGRKRWRSAILRLRVQIAAFIKNHPDHPSIGFWSDPEYFNDEIKGAMDRLKGL